MTDLRNGGLIPDIGRDARAVNVHEQIQCVTVVQCLNVWVGRLFESCRVISAPLAVGRQLLCLLLGS